MSREIGGRVRVQLSASLVSQEEEGDTQPNVSHTQSLRRSVRKSTVSLLHSRITRKSKSSVDVILDGYEGRDTAVGALSTWRQWRNPNIYKERLCEVEHVIARLDQYSQSIVGSIHEDSRIIWRSFNLLSHIALEFIETTPFCKKLIAALDEDVKSVVGERLREHNFPRSYLPWSLKGQKYERSLLKHLAQKWPEIVCDCSSLLEAVQKLKWMRTEETHPDSKQLESLIDERLLNTYKENREEENFWKHGAYTRAFCIGLKDLWKKKDLKALIYILQRAQKVFIENFEDSDDEQDEDKMEETPQKELEETSQADGARGFFSSCFPCWQESTQESENSRRNEEFEAPAGEHDLLERAYKEPFGWTYCMAILAGHHITKFTGDSEALAILAERMARVTFAELPKFVHRLTSLKTILTLEISRIHDCQIQVLTLTGAILVSSSNFGFQILHKYLEESSLVA